jgi:hypothetical protein
MLSSDNTHNLDHNCVTVFFTKSLLIGDLPAHRIKQKKEWRSFYDVKNTTKEQWSSFKEHLQEHLITNELNPIHSAKQFSIEDGIYLKHL